jgi:hypothetical protein
MPCAPKWGEQKKEGARTENEDITINVDDVKSSN